MNRPLILYYLATLIFLLLDYWLGLNVRIAFLESWPVARLAYYLLCFACLALMVWRPAWSAVIAAVESLTAVVALTFSMAVRVMIVTDEMIDTGRGFVSMEEIVNYLIVGSIAYMSLLRHVQSLKVSKST